MSYDSCNHQFTNMHTGFDVSHMKSRSSAGRLINMKEPGGGHCLRLEGLQLN